MQSISYAHYQQPLSTHPNNATRYQAKYRHLADVPAISLPNGCNSLNPDLIVMLERFEKIYLWLDNDQPGRDAAEKFASKLGLKRCVVVKPDPSMQPSPPKDANDALRSLNGMCYTSATDLLHTYTHTNTPATRTNTPANTITPANTHPLSHPSHFLSHCISIALDDIKQTSSYTLLYNPPLIPPLIPLLFHLLSHCRTFKGANWPIIPQLLDEAKMLDHDRIQGFGFFRNAVINNIRNKTDGLEGNEDNVGGRRYGTIMTLLSWP